MIQKYSVAGQVLDMKTNDSIAAEIATRQLEVITKSYQYLSSVGNNVIYIADEVGLGKTYIALGIAMLFRQHSGKPEQHNDIIFVPKKNLQQKWQKELRNFVQHNYKAGNEFIKALGSLPVVKEKLCPVKATDAVSIFRMTALSAVASSRRDRDLYCSELINSVFAGNEFFKNLLLDAKSRGYFRKENDSKLFKLVAYLMNAASENVNCLIVDEAHNYKHGLGDENHDAAIRNEVTARFLGAVKDHSILNDFPGLKARLKFPLAEKVICLSATPKDRSLFEIKNQLSCFTDNHVLKTCNTKDDINDRLRSFLIRGNMEYEVEGGKKASRNQCRHEHRDGNVNKSEHNPQKLIVEDSFDSVFWQLLQYKSIKHLEEKNNASFEIGMLAGFESYCIDTDKKVEQVQDDDTESYSPESKEYEQTSKRSIKESQDSNVVRQLVESFEDSFPQELPPHPKQSKLEEELVQQLSRQEKSLIFVRRVATAYELEKRLLHCFEQLMVRKLELNGKYAKFNSIKLNQLLEAFNDKFVQERLDDCLVTLLSRKEIKEFIAYKLDSFSWTNAIALEWLRYSYYDQVNPFFRSEVKHYVTQKKKNINTEFKDNAIASLERSFIGWQNEVKELAQEEEGEDEVDEDEISGYFFQSYFKKGRRGYYFRQKMYRENWFDLNYFLILAQYKAIDLDTNSLMHHVKSTIIGKDKKKYQVFQHYQHLFKEFASQNGSIATISRLGNKVQLPELNARTFLTNFLASHCKLELEQWFEKRKKTPSAIIEDLSILGCILLNIFRNGSGLLPAFVADASGKEFEEVLTELIIGEEAPFNFVHEEIKTIINDFDILIAVNFQEKDERKINTSLRSMVPVIGVSGQHKRDRSIVATQFRMPGYPYVLVSTDIFREGEDLHTYCQNVYHYGIAWNPSDMEQRTGRIDRINSMSYRKLNRERVLNFENKVQVFYPYLVQSVEVNQVARLLKNINQFIETFNSIETDKHFSSEVRVDEEIANKDIPKAIKHRLISKYDVHDFNVLG